MCRDWRVRRSVQHIDDRCQHEQSGCAQCQAGSRRELHVPVEWGRGSWWGEVGSSGRVRWVRKMITNIVTSVVFYLFIYFLVSTESNPRCTSNTNYDVVPLWEYVELVCSVFFTGATPRFQPTVALFQYNTSSTSDARSASNSIFPDVHMDQKIPSLTCLVNLPPLTFQLQCSSDVINVQCERDLFKTPRGVGSEYVRETCVGSEYVTSVDSYRKSVPHQSINVSETCVRWGVNMIGKHAWDGEWIC